MFWKGVDMKLDTYKCLPYEKFDKSKISGHT